MQTVCVILKPPLTCRRAEFHSFNASSLSYVPRSNRPYLTYCYQLHTGPLGWKLLRAAEKWWIISLQQSHKFTIIMTNLQPETTCLFMQLMNELALITYWNAASLACLNSARSHCRREKANDELDVGRRLQCEVSGSFTSPVQKPHVCYKSDKSANELLYISFSGNYGQSRPYNQRLMECTVLSFALQDSKNKHLCGVGSRVKSLVMCLQ